MPYGYFTDDYIGAIEAGQWRRRTFRLRPVRAAARACRRKISPLTQDWRETARCLRSRSG